MKNSGTEDSLPWPWDFMGIDREDMGEYDRWIEQHKDAHCCTWCCMHCTIFTMGFNAAKAKYLNPDAEV